MKSFKQVLALLVVATMMLSTVAFAAVVPSDVVGTKNEAAVTLLSALNIMVGDDQGKFNADATVKRSEMAKIVVKMVGSDSAATAAKGTATFSDVPADHWANGYVNVASSLGIVKGIGDGKFAPDAEVTYAQAITMIMRALGYEPAANDRGGYPNGYYVLANQYDVTDGVDTPSTTAAVRGSIAELIVNALDAPLMIQNGYGTDAHYVESGTDETKIEYVITKKLKLDWYKGTVKSYDSEDKKVDFEKIYVRAEDADDDDDDDGFKDAQYSAGKSYDYKDISFNANVKGTEVEYFVNNDDDVVAYKLPKDSETFFSSIKTFNDDSDTQYTSIDNSTHGYTLDTTGEEIESITFNNGQKYNVSDELKESGNVRVFKKGQVPLESDDVKVDDSDDWTDAAGYDLKKMLVKGTVVEGELTKLYFYEFESTTGMVTEVSDSTIKFSKDGTTSATGTITRLNVADSITVIKDGAVASIKDIQKGMYIEYTRYKDPSDSDEYTYIIGVSGTPVSGTVTKIASGSDEFYVGSTKLKIASKYYVSTNGGSTYKVGADIEDSLDNLLQEKVDVVTNLVGKAVFVKGTSTNVEFYGIAEEEYSSGGDDYIKVLVSNNGTFERKSYAKSDDDYVQTQWVAANATPAPLAGSLVTKDTFESANPSPAPGFLHNAVYKFTLDSDGKIEEVYKPQSVFTKGVAEKPTASPDPVAVTYKLNDAYNQVSVMNTNGATKQYDVDSDVVFADTKKIATKLTESNLPTSVSWDSLKGKDLNSTFMLALVLDDNDDVVMGIMDNGTSGLTSDNLKFAYVTDKWSTNDDEVSLEMITGDGVVTKTMDATDAKNIVANKAIIYEDINTNGIDVPSDQTAVFTLGTSYGSWTVGTEYLTGDTSYKTFKDVATEDFTDTDTIIVNNEKVKVAANAFVVSYDEDKGEFVEDEVTNIEDGDSFWYIIDTDAEVVRGVVFVKAN